MTVGNNASQRRRLFLRLEGKAEQKLAKTIVLSLFFQGRLLRQQLLIDWLKEEEFPLGIWAAGEKRTYRWQAAMLSGAGNEYQGKKAIFALAVVAREEGEIAGGQTMATSQVKGAFRYQGLGWR